MRYLFTTSSDISDGVILAFDMKTREIRITDHRSTDGAFEKLPFTVDDLFDTSCHHRLPQMAFSDLVYRYEAFNSVIRNLTELDESGTIRLKPDNTLAIEVSVDHYQETVEPHRCDRTLTGTEFANVLIGNLNRAQTLLYFRTLLERDIAIRE